MEMMLVVDHKKCTGCRLCEMICSVKHAGMNNPYLSRIQIMKQPMVGFEFPMLCLQCAKAPCITVCPKGALSQDPAQRRVKLNNDLCIRCNMCATVCPFGAMGEDFNSQQMIKCDLCDGDPACVHVCKPGALQFAPIKSVRLKDYQSLGSVYAELIERYVLG
jgi:Fe-S-cluster-containing hydrogenase component 2